MLQFGNPREKQKTKNLVNETALDNHLIILAFALHLFGKCERQVSRLGKLAERHLRHSPIAMSESDGALSKKGERE